MVQLLSAFLLLKQTHFSVIVLPAYRNNDLLIWPGGEVVTLESAKLPCAGSIPAQASRERANDFARGELVFNFLKEVRQFFDDFSHLYL